jgi:hypothetical protein
MEFNLVLVHGDRVPRSQYVSGIFRKIMTHPMGLNEMSGEDGRWMELAQDNVHVKHLHSGYTSVSGGACYWLPYQTEKRLVGVNVDMQ